MIIKRHLSYKSSIACTRLKPGTLRGVVIPRHPLTSVYVARVDYYLPARETVQSISAIENNLSGNTVYSTEVDSHLPGRLTDLVSQTAPMVTLPFIPSILSEFTAYADAIQSEQPRDTRHPSTCIPEPVLASMGSDALCVSSILPLPGSLTWESAIPSLSLLKKLDVLHPESNGLRVSKAFEENQKTAAKVEGAFMTAFFTSGEVSTIDSQGDGADVVCDDDGLIESYTADQDAIEQICTTQMVPPSATFWSVQIDSFSTLGSLLAARLAEFPSVPTFLPIGTCHEHGALFSAYRSQSSISSTVSRSLSAPASLNILEIRVEDSLPQRRANELLALGWSNITDPGELWDEEDDILFSVFMRPKLIDHSKPTRYTWTAGVSYSHKDSTGELWDDDDDRRFSFHSAKFDALAAFASLSLISIRMDNDRIVGMSSLISTTSASLEGQTDRDASDGVRQSQDPNESEHTLPASFNSDFGEEPSYFDCNIASTDEPEADSIYCDKEFTPRSWSASPSSLQLFAFEDLVAKRTSVRSSGSTWSSLMSLASVLDTRIHIVDPVHDPEDPSTKAFGVVDMELEPDHSYSSQIVSTYLPLSREVCTV
ncbi:hypothetical protein EW145_g4002 [Phellinidium pouzarii]|uniref:Uncharacterized protein n=1 Tax=Phellinidium pouzarii TaxID=167371 RepID=A0A4S4L5A5_9AGAM|nr:hypothetical protein EW145_g4002 [Phellinidium pouzarii]